LQVPGQLRRLRGLFGFLVGGFVVDDGVFRSFVTVSSTGTFERIDAGRFPLGGQAFREASKGTLGFVLAFHHGGMVVVVPIVGGSVDGGSIMEMLRNKEEQIDFLVGWDGREKNGWLSAFF
jgi:hypothetical protein